MKNYLKYILFIALFTPAFAFASSLSITPNPVPTADTIVHVLTTSTSCSTEAYFIYHPDGSFDGYFCDADYTDTWANIDTAFITGTWHFVLMPITFDGSSSTYTSAIADPSYMGQDITATFLPSGGALSSIFGTSTVFSLAVSATGDLGSFLYSILPLLLGITIALLGIGIGFNWAIIYITGRKF